jgi:hypothetical protein
MWNTAEIARALLLAIELQIAIDQVAERAGFTEWTGALPPVPGNQSSAPGGNQGCPPS